MDWIARLNQVMDGIEHRLAAEIHPESLARMTCCSVSQFHRIFAALTNIPLAEYIRRRRMTKAAVDLQQGATVLNTALKYGYDSPTAFNRAFRQIHGLPPSFAKRQGVRLKSYPPIRFHITIKGEVEMEYRIVTKEAFSVLGMERTFTMKDGSSFVEIPKFWCEFFAKGYGETVSGMYGICVDASMESQDFRYLIADDCAPDATVPEGFTKEIIPALTWAIFEGKGPMPHALQQLNRRIYEEWLPTNEQYALGAGYGIEYYTCGDTSAEEYGFEIWLPVQAKG